MRRSPDMAILDGLARGRASIASPRRSVNPHARLRAFTKGVGVSARGWLVVLLVLAAVALAGLAFFRAEGTPPVLIAPPSLVVNASGRDVEIAASDAGSGVRELSAVFSHAGGDHEIALELYPGSWLRGGDAGADRSLTLRIDPKALGSAEGSGFLRVTRARLVVARRLRRQPDQARGAGDDRPHGAARVGRQRPDLRRARRLGRGRLFGLRAHRARRRTGRRALLPRRAASGRQRPECAHRDLRGRDRCAARAADPRGRGGRRRKLGRRQLVRGAEGAPVPARQHHASPELPRREGAGARAAGEAPRRGSDRDLPADQLEAARRERGAHPRAGRRR